MMSRHHKPVIKVMIAESILQKMIGSLKCQRVIQRPQHRLKRMLTLTNSSKIKMVMSRMSS